MITAQKEIFEHGLSELRPILPVHWNELALNKDVVPLDPLYELYIEREKRDELLYITLREDGKLIGYFIYFISPGLHYRTCLTAIMDIFYVHPDYRGKNGGLILLEFSKQQLQMRGVKRWFVGHKEHSQQAGILFSKFGFEKVETTYSMWLGE